MTLLLQGLVKIFPGPVQAVEAFDLEVAAGELIAVLGPSGCGKTTLLRMIAGLEEPSAGQIVLDGRAIHGLPPRERGVAILFQHHSLFPHMTAFENIAYGLRVRGTPAAEAALRVREAGELLGIASLLERYPRALSGGERQRVALGRALVRQPRVFLLDEPLASLDAHRRAELRVEIARLHRRLGTITLVVTHDQAEAMALADRIVVMRDGRIQQVADPAALYERPCNRFVAGFVGVPAMNFFEGTLRASGAALVLDYAGFPLEIPAALRPHLAPRLGRSLVMGVRPERLRPALPGAGSRGLRGRVEAVEPQGAQRYVRVQRDAGGFIALAPGEAVGAGSEGEWSIDPQGLHFFDPETGEAVGK